MTQQELVLDLLRRAKSRGVNSYSLTYDYAIKQGPTRVKELRALGYTIISERRENRSVQYILIEKQMPAIHVGSCTQGGLF